MREIHGSPGTQEDAGRRQPPELLVSEIDGLDRTGLVPADPVACAHE
jgi:hypothetical protein